MVIRAERLAPNVIGAVFAMANGVAFAQVAADVAAPAPVTELASPGRRSFTVEPRVSWSETLTNNIDLTTTQRSGLVSELVPGVRITGNTARVNAYADYAVRASSHDTSDSGTTRLQQSLNAFGNVDVFDRWVFVDLSGAIAQQAISAFGRQSAGSANLNSNNTETSSFRVSPFVRGRFMGSSDYEIRHSQIFLSSDSAAASDLRTVENSLKIEDVSSRLPAWSIDASSRQDDYASGQVSESERVRAMVAKVFFSELQVSLTAGREANDFASVEKESSATRGYSVRWAPGPRVEASVGHEKRFFGTSRSLNLSYRTPRGSWRISETRDVSAIPNQFSTAGLGNIYDLMFARLASAQPDPILRAQAVNDFLSANGIDANTPVTAGFLATRVTLQRVRDLEISMYRQRTSVILLARETSSEAFSTAIPAIADDFSTAAKVLQRGVTLTLSQRMTRNTTLNLTGGGQRTSANGLVPLRTTLKFGELGVTTRLSTRTTVALVARRNVFESPTTPYKETAMAGTLSTTF